MTRSIYVVRSEPGPVKIGISGKPRRRLSLLRTSSAVPLFMEFEAECVGDVRHLETRAHNILEAHHLSGEWFRVDSSAAVAAVMQAAEELGFVLRQSIPDNQKRRGRPATGKTPISAIRLPPDLMASLESWIADQPDPKPSRSEAVRMALRDWLIGMGYLSHHEDPEMSN